MMEAPLHLSSNTEYREIMLNMMVDIMARQNIILAQLTDMNNLDPDFIDQQIMEEKKVIVQQFSCIYQPD